MSIKKEKIKVSDMHCSSCEKAIEKEIRKLRGVLNVIASYPDETVFVEYDSKLCDIITIKAAITMAGYGVEKKGNNKFMGILIITAAIFFLGKFTGGFNMAAVLGENTTFFVLFVVGLLTSIHCVGMCGGIMLSQSISADAKNRWQSLKPALLYNSGRVVSYTILGGAVGALGSVLSISLKLKAAIAVFAGLFMIIMGLNMAGFQLFRKLNIRMPWTGCSVKNKSKAPFIVGIFNGFLPCGPLQTMQLYALGTGSAVQGALSMFFFSIGTVPLMLTFGMAAGFLSKGYTKKILKLSGILVIFLGLVMANRGFALSGIRLFPGFNISTQTAAENGLSAAKAEIKDGVQIISMRADRYGYTPSVLYLQKGIPVKWIIDGAEITSCNNQIVVPSLNIQQDLLQGENLITFTPESSGEINFSCWMGMINGVFVSVDNLDDVDLSTADVVPSSSGGCGGGSTGCSSPFKK